MMLSLIDDLNKKIDPIKEWIFSQNKNFVFWVGIIIGALVIFGFTYSALQREK